MKRGALILLAAVGAGVALGPGSAGAGETANDTVVTSEPLAGGGYKLIVTAAAGQANIIDTGMDLDYSAVRDTEAGITDDSSKCVQESPTEVRCKLQGLRRVAINTGDMGDVVRVIDTTPPVLSLPGVGVRTGPGADRANINLTDPSGNLGPSSVRTGPGKDTAEVAGRASVKGSGGGDTLQGRRGNQRLLGGRGRDHITGGRGNNDHCDGDAGNDSGGAGCETERSL